MMDQKKFKRLKRLMELAKLTPSKASIGAGSDFVRSATIWGAVPKGSWQTEYMDISIPDNRLAFAALMMFMHEVYPEYIALAELHSNSHDDIKQLLNEVRELRKEIKTPVSGGSLGFLTKSMNIS